MAEDNPFVGFHEVFAVIMYFARRGPTVVQREDPRSNPFRVEAKTDGVGAERGGEDVGGVDRLIPPDGEDAIGPCAQECDGQPNGVLDQFVHALMFHWTDARDGGFGCYWILPGG